jgi:soluble lytic murein transglycosylase-like protein
MQERDGVLYVKNVEPASASFRPRSAPGTLSADSYRGLIREAAERHAVAPALVESVVRVESNFEPRAVSPKGARGLMQLMPATAARLGVRNLFDARENIDAGVRHLRYLLDLYQGNVSFALAAYNAGVEAVAKYRGIPPYAETQAYVARILRLLEQGGVSTARVAPVRPVTTLYRFEAPDGRVVYSNVPLDRLSSATRAMLKGQE